MPLDKEKNKIYQKVWRDENKDKVRQHRLTTNLNCPGKEHEYVRKYRMKRRLEALSHYSNGKMVCLCCGESNVEFLALDHIDGGGVRHKRENKIGSIYPWLRKRGYPEGYRVLCHNCNMSLGFYGYCPHNNLPPNMPIKESE